MSAAVVHTPAPWELLKSPDKQAWFGFVEHKRGKRRKEFIAAVATSIRATGQDEANAHLIAAAPELLGGARKIMAFLKDLGDSNPGFMGKLALQDYQQWNEAMLELPAAIAKAEGRQ